MLPLGEGHGLVFGIRRLKIRQDFIHGYTPAVVFSDTARYKCGQARPRSLTAFGTVLRAIPLILVCALAQMRLRRPEKEPA